MPLRWLLAQVECRTVSRVWVMGVACFSAGFTLTLIMHTKHVTKYNNNTMRSSS
jgi:uncharacterized membrane protein (DUF485 family)